MFRTKNILLIVTTFALLGNHLLLAQGREADHKNETPIERNWFWDIVLYFKGDNYEVPIDNATTGLLLVVDLQQLWKFSIGDNQNWRTPTYNDTNWETIRVPADWENEGFNGYDGYAWYRLHFDGRKLKKNQGHFIVLGFIDDVDETYLNGNLIGRSGRFPPKFRTAYNSYRKYYLPAESINFEGDNVIAVRVFDEHLNGGIVSGKPGIYAPDHEVELLQNLYGLWKFTKFNNRSYSLIEYNDEAWEELLVPSYWDNQGYKSIEGNAWYRKKFKLSFNLEDDETYYLVLGKIDDFDVTYLNGVKIGETNDGESFGSSKSYMQTRVYKIPHGLLQQDGENLIAIKVYDLGLEGGIYKGPVGIVQEAHLTSIIRRNY